MHEDERKSGASPATSIPSLLRSSEGTLDFMTLSDSMEQELRRSIAEKIAVS